LYTGPILYQQGNTSEPLPIGIQWHALIGAKLMGLFYHEAELIG